GPAPAAARPGPAGGADSAQAGADAERRRGERTWRLRVTTHPPGAQLSIKAAGATARRARTPFEGTLRGGELELTVTRAGHNRLVQRVALDRHRALDLWLDPAGLLHHKLGELRSGSNPKQVAFSPDGRELWVSLLGGRGVEVFDTRTMRKRKAIRLGEHGAVEVLFTGDGRTVYASQMETASVWEIDRASFKVRRQLPTKGNWSKVMALSPDERTLYVANWVSSDISEIDLRKGRVRRLLKTVRTPRGLWPTTDGRRLYVAGFEDGELQRIDLASGKARTLLRTGGAMRHLVGDPEGRRLYADDMGTNQAFVVDLASERVRRLATTGNVPNTIDLTPDGRVLYVSNRGRNGASYYLPGPEWGSVLAIDTASGKVLDAMVGGNQTTGLDVSADGRLLAFSDFLDNRIHVFAVPPYRQLAAGGGGRATAHRAELAKR
ncbi:MAG TPA: YncE family protein, partial [Actinomycetota bacterium]|nr:YncE family protein [Actinomycetota bacterium]